MDLDSTLEYRSPLPSAPLFFRPSVLLTVAVVGILAAPLAEGGNQGRDGPRDRGTLVWSEHWTRDKKTWLVGGWGGSDWV